MLYPSFEKCRPQEGALPSPEAELLLEVGLLPLGLPVELLLAHAHRLQERGRIQERLPLVRVHPLELGPHHLRATHLLVRVERPLAVLLLRARPLSGRHLVLLPRGFQGGAPHPLRRRLGLGLGLSLLPALDVRAVGLASHHQHGGPVREPPGAQPRLVQGLLVHGGGERCGLLRHLVFEGAHRGLHELPAGGLLLGALPRLRLGAVVQPRVHAAAVRHHHQVAGGAHHPRLALLHPRPLEFILLALVGLERRLLLRVLDLALVADVGEAREGEGALRLGAHLLHRNVRLGAVVPLAAGGRPGAGRRAGTAGGAAAAGARGGVDGGGEPRAPGDGGGRGRRGEDGTALPGVGRSHRGRRGQRRPPRGARGGDRARRGGGRGGAWRRLGGRLGPHPRAHARFWRVVHEPSYPRPRLRPRLRPHPCRWDGDYRGRRRNGGGRSGSRAPLRRGRGVVQALAGARRSQALGPAGRRRHLGGGGGEGDHIGRAQRSPRRRRRRRRHRWR
mmetsp:Transcript_35651/g.112458  ORF Transcript_35651/g.112458 Transcript_35651/m.112458 type:complete len:504 (+) Transcript_35651:113-1624(+)